MIAIVAPEPARWVSALCELCAGLGPVHLLAPWALAGTAPAWLPARARRAWARRRLPGGTACPPLWLAAEAVGRLWAGARTDRVMALRFARRAAIDAIAARWCARLPPGVRLLVAPSLGARASFAAAAACGWRRLLIEDLPGLRRLHDDLDRAARLRPESAFLRRYRAAPALVARQEAEWSLADGLCVRGTFAARQRRRRGLSQDRVIVWPDPAPGAAPPREPRTGAAPTILLAGEAAARGGVFEALAALRALPRAVLLVRPGEGTEPSDLLAHPSVRIASATERDLAGVDLVLAPALCESYPPEVPRAARLGIPVVATAHAAGAVDLDQAGARVPPGDAGAIAAAVARLSTWRRPAGPPADPDRAMRELAGRLLANPGPARRLAVLAADPTGFSAFVESGGGGR